MLSMETTPSAELDPRIAHKQVIAWFDEHVAQTGNNLGHDLLIDAQNIYAQTEPIPAHGSRKDRTASQSTSEAINGCLAEYAAATDDAMLLELSLPYTGHLQRIEVLTKIGKRLLKAPITLNNITPPVLAKQLDAFDKELATKHPLDELPLERDTGTLFWWARGNAKLALDLTKLDTLQNIDPDMNLRIHEAKQKLILRATRNIQSLQDASDVTQKGGAFTRRFIDRCKRELWHICGEANMSFCLPDFYAPKAKLTIVHTYTDIYSAAGGTLNAITREQYVKLSQENARPNGRSEALGVLAIAGYGNYEQLFRSCSLAERRDIFLGEDSQRALRHARPDLLRLILANEQREARVDSPDMIDDLIAAGVPNLEGTLYDHYQQCQQGATYGSSPAAPFWLALKLSQLYESGLIQPPAENSQ